MSAQRYSRHSCRFPPPTSLPLSSRLPSVSPRAGRPRPQAPPAFPSDSHPPPGWGGAPCKSCPELSLLSQKSALQARSCPRSGFLGFQCRHPSRLPASRGRAAAFGYSPHASLPRASRWGVTGKSHLPDVGDFFACFPRSLCGLCGLCGWKSSRSPAAKNFFQSLENCRSTGGPAGCAGGKVRIPPGGCRAVSAEGLGGRQGDACRLLCKPPWTRTSTKPGTGRLRS